MSKTALDNHWLMIKCSLLDLEQKAKVIQRSSGITNNRMAESGWFAFNQFNRSDTTKRMNDVDGIRLAALSLSSSADHA